MWRRWLDRSLLALRRPDLAWRRLKGGDVSGVRLDEISPHLGPRPIIVEAGAETGGDTLRFAKRWPDAEIHAFEPLPWLFDLVDEKTRHMPQVHRYPLALADRTGSRAMFVSRRQTGGGEGSSSLLEPSGHLLEYPEVAFDEQIVVQAVTLRDWAEASDISRIDLLWLDLQGMELPVLKASPEVLARTHVVAMEVSRQELYHGSPLYPEVMSWMKSQGFEAVIDRVLVTFGNVLFVNRSTA
jgi:FkbM family methyltransferase